MNYLELGPLERVCGSVQLPGSKSLSNRILLLAALAEGETLVHDVLDSDDTRHMRQALRALGVEWRQAGAKSVVITGARGVFPEKKADLFLGNAGTAFRPLAAVLAVMGGEYRLSGVPRMHQRPIQPLVDALRSIGADVDYLGEAGFPPLQVHPAQLNLERQITVRGDVSSQFVTALLVALPLTRRACTLRIEGELISRPYVDITLNVMRRFGVAVESADDTFVIPAGSRYSAPQEIFVEGDASSASYFLAAGAISGLTGGGPVRVQGVGRSSIQGDVRFAEVLERMGAKIIMSENWIEASAGDAAAKRGKLKAFDADLNHIPDAAMTAAIAALFAEGTSTLRNLASWRVKETDRISAMASELRKVGAAVEEGADYLKVTPPMSGFIPCASIDTYDDHRMAMCFSLVALGGVPVRINDPLCVNKTFPDYFEALASISQSRRA